MEKHELNSNLPIPLDTLINIKVPVFYYFLRTLKVDEEVAPFSFFMKRTDIEIAKHLTQIEFNIFEKIRVRSCVNLADYDLVSRIIGTSMEQTHAPIQNTKCVGAHFEGKQNFILGG